VFDEVFTGNGIRVIKTPVRSPRANSFAERYAETLRRECLHQMLIYGERAYRAANERDAVFAQPGSVRRFHSPEQAADREMEAG